MGCISCKKLQARPLPRPPSPHALPLQYLQQQKGGPQGSSANELKGSPSSVVGSETQQGPVESTFSPADTLRDFASPPLSVTDGEREGFVKQHERDGGRAGNKLLSAAPFPLVGWPEEKETQEEGETISTEAQQESLKQWLQGGDASRQQQQKQPQLRQKQDDMIIPMRSNDFYGYRQGNSPSPPPYTMQHQQQQQQQQQETRDKRELSVETLACVRRGFDACVLRDTTKAQVELRKAEGLYAVLLGEGGAAAPANVASRRRASTASLRWPAAAARGSNSCNNPIETDIEKRILNLRNTLRDLQGGFLAADARRALFTHTPTSPVPSPAAAAAAAARRQKVVIPAPRTSANRRLTAS